MMGQDSLYEPLSLIPPLSHEAIPRIGIVPDIIRERLILKACVIKQNKMWSD